MNVHNFRFAIILSAAVIVSCGQKTEEATETESPPADVAEQAPPAPPAQADSNPVTAALSLEDIERWQRGVQAEAKAVQEASAKADAAKNQEEQLEALMAATGMKTIDVGANAAGLGADRYRFVRDAFSNAVAQMVPLEMDTTSMPKEMVDQLQQARDAGLAQLADKIPPDVMEALRSKATEFRQQDLKLAGERMKVAQKAR